jgi:hypothetical protein
LSVIFIHTYSIKCVYNSLFVFYWNRKQTKCKWGRLFIIDEQHLTNFQNVTPKLDQKVGVDAENKRFINDNLLNKLITFIIIFCNF